MGVGIVSSRRKFDPESEGNNLWTPSSSGACPVPLRVEASELGAEHPANIRSRANETWRGRAKVEQYDCVFHGSVNGLGGSW